MAVTASTAHRIMSLCLRLTKRSIEVLPMDHDLWEKEEGHHHPAWMLPKCAKWMVRFTVDGKRSEQARRMNSRKEALQYAAVTAAFWLQCVKDETAEVTEVAYPGFMSRDQLTTLKLRERRFGRCHGPLAKLIATGC